MAAEKNLQEPVTFEEVSVSLTEEKEFALDPYLFALNGNNIQQYCTMLSWLAPANMECWELYSPNFWKAKAPPPLAFPAQSLLPTVASQEFLGKPTTELQNPKPEMFLETEQGPAMPLSLVQVAEEFEVLPSSYPGDGAVPTEQSEPLWPGSTTPLVRLQYNFVRESEGGILRGKPSDDLIDLQTRSWEATGGNLSMSPGHPDMFRESEASVPQEKGSQQPTATCFAAVEQNQGTVPWGYEQSSTQDDIKCNALPGNNARREGCCCDRGTREALQTGVSHRPSSNMGDGFHEPLSFRVHKGVLTKKAPKLCPNCGRKLSLGLNPAAHPLAPSKEKSFQCPDCGHQLRFCTGVPKHQADPADDWEGLFSQLSLGPLPNQMGAGVEKPFKCPDCRKGFSHRSSIRRHQRLHKKENTSPDFGQERNSGLGPKLLMHPKSKPVQHPSDRMGSIPSSPPKPSCLHNPRFPALSGDSGQGGSVASEAPSDRASAEKPFLCPDCGKTFSVKSTVLRHQMLHWAQRPFKCSYCDKSYIQKSHLKRHEQMKHGCPRLEGVGALTQPQGASASPKVVQCYFTEKTSAPEGLSEELDVVVLSEWWLLRKTVSAGTPQRGQEAGLSHLWQ
ncbi:zinc finger protein 460-like [Varanus komodoensis]|uniref:zinc finger protein 460-like n=1 Tax=Varanus komodoensis TaxID=61221 RepID=UPI001CF7E24B|nr:zinc finger protein 460-like [Varanus komodoensis]